MDEDKRKELECALWASIGVAVSVYPYLGWIPNFALSVLAGAHWVVVRYHFEEHYKNVGWRRANYLLFWVLAGIGGTPMILSIHHGRQVGVASLLLPFLMAGVSGMTGQIRDLLRPWPEEKANVDNETKALEHQLCLAYFQTSGGMIPTVFAGVLIFSLWRQVELTRISDPLYLPYHDALLTLYAVGIYVMYIVQPGLNRAKLIRREIVIHRVVPSDPNALGGPTATTIPILPQAPFPVALDRVTASSSSKAVETSLPCARGNSRSSTSDAPDKWKIRDWITEQRKKDLARKPDV
jgi:hypothetical protein